jgi:hypothetical protein
MAGISSCRDSGVSFDTAWWLARPNPVVDLAAKVRARNSGRKKTGPQAGFFKCSLITWQRQRPKQPKQPTKQQQQRPKQPKQRSKRQQQRQQLEQRRRQQLELQEQQQRQRQVLLELQQLELLLVQELLLFCCKQPKQQPTGRRSAGIFSWVFLKIQK